MLESNVTIETSMAKKIKIFDELMEGFRDAIARKKGRHVALRVTEIRRADPTRPSKKNWRRYDKATPKF
jgi:hypothetical protein